MFTRGYKSVEESLRKKARYVRHCNNCRFYYADLYDKEEYCQNDNVTEYDIVVEGTTCFCSYWQPPALEKKEKEEKNDYLSRFKKGVRNVKKEKE